MKKWFKDTLKRLPGIRNYITTYPPGHYYSPIPDLKEIDSQSQNLFNKKRNNIPGIDLNLDTQIRTLNDLAPFVKAFPFLETGKCDGWKFSLPNGYFGLSDASILFGIMCSIKPKKVIEVGSGFSSVLMVDIDKHYLNSNTTFQFIEPYPERLLPLKLAKNEKVTILEKKVQEVTWHEMLALEANDILFIDSSHVSKTGSDLNYILFEILPKLQKGVIIHFHDIFYPFEYPEKWVKDWFKGFAWNEIYLIRALLTGNKDLEILFFNSMMEEMYQEKLQEAICLYKKDFRGGGSLWLRKVN